MYVQAIIAFNKTVPTLGRNMIGVILWSDPSDQKAVIWCEDQGDLAYLSRPDTLALAENFIDVGDVVEFEVSTERSMRLAHSVKLVSSGKAKSLVDDLHTSVPPEPNTMSGSAQVIPFRIDSPFRQTGSAQQKVHVRG